MPRSQTAAVAAAVAATRAIAQMPRTVTHMGTASSIDSSEVVVSMDGGGSVVGLNVTGVSISIDDRVRVEFDGAGGCHVVGVL